MTGTRITCTDLDTGEQESSDIRDDYAVICDGSAYVDSVAVHANGTHIITVKKEPTA